MMKRVIIYTNGQKAIMQNCSAEIHRLAKSDEIDLSMTTDDEFKKLFQNPHDDKLLQEIKKRPKLK